MNQLNDNLIILMASFLPNEWGHLPRLSKAFLKLSKRDDWIASLSPMIRPLQILPPCGRFDSLRKLDVDINNRAWVHHLLALTKLTELSVSDWQVLNGLQTLPYLQYLKLSDAVSIIVRLTTLQTLTFNSHVIPSERLQKLSTLVNMRKFTTCQKNEIDLSFCLRWPLLETLIIPRGTLSKQLLSLSFIQGLSKLKQLRTLNISRWAFADDVKDNLSCLSRLHTLDINGATLLLVGYSGVAKLTSLQKLTVEKSIDDAAFILLTTCLPLTTIILEIPLVTTM